MALAVGTHLGPYEILSLVGSGGMGEVYRARDTKLGRDVALKILPDSFTHDPERLARFRREAKVLASLNHSHIAQIHNLDEANGTQFLVLELVHGLNLADRIKRGPLPLDEALAIAKQIAEALEAAHEKGIIHRDLKPANVALAADGQAKVLDFGLAKGMEPIASDDPANRSTLTMLTRSGAILGTAAYMSPEQVKGRPADKRSDIWAFGCVLFEALTGTSAFAGETYNDVLAAVMKNEPDWHALPADTPQGIRSLLRRCLKKDPVFRLHDIADARIEIQEVVAEPPAMSQPASQRRAGARWTRAIPWGVAAVFGVAVALLAWQQGFRRTVSSTGPVARLELNLPAGVELSTVFPPAAALSPDGTRVAFVGVLGPIRQLYLRRIDQFETVPLQGTENGYTIFFSPDGGSLGFITADRSLKKVSLADGLVITVGHDADYSVGGAWGADDRITFGRDGVLWQVPASGGPAQRLTTLHSANRELFHAWPTVIAGGKVVLFASITGSSRDAVHIEALSLADGKRRVIVESGTFPLYAPSGHLIFFRDGALLGAPFDVARLEVTGPFVRVVENLAMDDTTGAPLAALSNSGSLVYAASDSGTKRLVWVSRQGVEQPVTETPRRYLHPRLASDGQRIIVAAAGDLWLQDTARATFTRLTSERTVGNAFPAWTWDNKRVVFRTLTGMHWTAVDGSGRVQAIAGSRSVVDIPNSVSPDGDTVAFVRLSAGTSGDVYVLSLRGESPPRPVVNTRAFEGGPQFSPDGRWMAYASNESGQMQVYLRPFPGPDRRLQVSTRGGTQPRWSRNGKEVFYRDGNKMMVVDVSTSPDLTLSPARLLFEHEYVFQNISIPNYDVSPDGQRLLMIRDETGSGRLNVVLNWFEELGARVPAK